MAEVDTICARAQAAFAVWSRTSREERAVILDKVASALDASTDELAAIADGETALDVASASGPRARSLRHIPSLGIPMSPASSAASLSGYSSPEKINMGYLLPVCLAATLGGLLFGHGSGVISGAIEPLTAKLSLTHAL